MVPRMSERPFRVLGVQQIAVGASDKSALLLECTRHDDGRVHSIRERNAIRRNDRWRDIENYKLVAGCCCCEEIIHLRSAEQFVDA